MSRLYISPMIYEKMKCFELQSSMIEGDYRERQSHEEYQDQVKSHTMMSTPSSLNRINSDGLILPKKILNPCSESADRKMLHKELMFINKTGKNVLNRKSELQRILEKKADRQVQIQHHQQEADEIESRNQNELNRAIEERALRINRNVVINPESGIEIRLNPVYTNVREKLRSQKK